MNKIIHRKKNSSCLKSRFLCTQKKRIRTAVSMQQSKKRSEANLKTQVVTKLLHNCKSWIGLTDTHNIQ